MRDLSRFTPISGREYRIEYKYNFTMIKREYAWLKRIRGLDTKHLVRVDPRQMQQLSHAFAAPLAKSRGKSGRRGAQFGNRCYRHFGVNLTINILSSFIQNVYNFGWFVLAFSFKTKQIPQSSKSSLPFYKQKNAGMRASAGKCSQFHFTMLHFP